SIIKADDINKSGSSEIGQVMEELVASLSDAKIIVLLAELKEREVVGYVHVHPNLASLEVFNLLSAQMVEGTLGTFKFLGKTVAEVETEVLSRLDKLKDLINK
ncbi:MAG: hypothetical protein Q8N81_00495, partial [bacterium]|nr:hypothetical protein [bacterium]